MSNVIELNIAEIDTVVGGAGAIQTAIPMQMSVTSLSASTMVHVPTKAPGANSLSVGGFDISAIQAQLLARR